MQEQSIKYGFGEVESNKTISSAFNSFMRSTTANVSDEVKAQTKAFTPWYAAVKPQPLVLNKEVRAKIFNEDNRPFQVGVDNDLEFWKELMIMCYQTKLLPTYEIDALLEAPVGTNEQVQAAEWLAEKVLSKYQSHINIHNQSIEKELINNGLFIDVEKKEWLDSTSDSPWGCDLTIDDGGCFGENENPYDQINSGLKLRIQHEARPSSLLIDLDQYSAPLGQLFYRAIALISTLNYKMMTLDALLNTGDYEDGLRLIANSQLTKENLIELSKCNEEQLESELFTLDAKLTEQLVEYFDWCQILDMINNTIDSHYKGWFVANAQRPEERNSVEFIYIAKQILSELNKIRLNSISHVDQLGKETLATVLKTAIKMIRCGSDEDNHWDNASDTPLECFSYINFNTNSESTYLKCENEARQSIGENGAISLNLSDKVTGFNTIENILLGDACLMILASA